nr:isoprenylcysteine carboxylmethyltransferase family protein [Sphingomonas sp. CV7422]
MADWRAADACETGRYGRNWSPGLELREGHRLVTGGVYALWRHPMYVSIWLAAFCQPLLVHNLIAGLLVVPAFAAMWWLRVPQEEAMMRHQFGEHYARYCVWVGRLWPRLGQ